MRVALAFTSLLLVAGVSYAADSVYLDEMVETPLSALQQQFAKLRGEGCYQLAAGEFLLISIDRKDQKPWRVIVTSEAPCRKPDSGPSLEVLTRSGIRLGDTTVAIVERLGRPDASAAPDQKLKRLGDLEYFYMCRVSEGCARHTSVFVKDGKVSAIAEWYSE